MKNLWFNKNLAINPAAIISEDAHLFIGRFLINEGKNSPKLSLEL